MVLTFPLISNLPIPLRIILGIAASASITIGIVITFIFYGCCFLFSCKVYVQISLFVSFYFNSVVCRDGKVHYLAGYPFYSTRSGRLNYYYIYSFRYFHVSVSWWFSTEFEWQQVSLSLQDSGDLTNAVVIFNSFRTYINPMVIVPWAPITSKVEVLMLFTVSFNFTLWLPGQKIHNPASSFFLVDYYRVWSSGRD